MRSIIFLSFAAAILSCLAVDANSQMIGGLRDEKVADQEVKDVINRLHADINKMSNKEFKSIEPISYRKQVVAGLNYFIKAKVVGQDNKVSHIHIRAYKPFKGDVELTAVKTDVDEKHPLNYFQ